MQDGRQKCISDGSSADKQALHLRAAVVVGISEAWQHSTSDFVIALDNAPEGAASQPVRAVRHEANYARPLRLWRWPWPPVDPLCPMAAKASRGGIRGGRSRLSRKIPIFHLPSESFAKSRGIGFGQPVYGLLFSGPTGGVPIPG